MAVPSRKNRMMQTIIQNQERDKKDKKTEIEDKKISEEEHNERLKMLKKMGLIKKK